MDDTHRIQFEAPNLQTLNSDHTVVDLHFHSNYSDGADTVTEGEAGNETV